MYFLSSIVTSYNRPNFCSNASWSSIGTTISNSSVVRIQPQGIWVDTNNTLYVADNSNTSYYIWIEGNKNQTKIFVIGLPNVYRVLPTIQNNIYVGNNDRVDKWTWNGTSGITMKYFVQPCYGLFIDSNSFVYCSMGTMHQVVKGSLDSIASPLALVAGTGCAGSQSNMLNNSNGIFVDTNFDLYVADSANNRIQLFPSGNSIGTTVAGTEAVISFTLDYPTDVILDGDGYLFIVDSGNNRIVASSASGFRCIIGCSGVSGSASNQLSSPRAMSFDTDGNILVADTDNNRIQKFFYATNSCSKYY